MQTFLSGLNATIAVPLTRGGEPFVPDAGTTTWSLRGNNGVEVIPSSNYTGPLDSTLLISVPAEHNDTATAWVEKRTILVQGTVDGVSFQARETYRITRFLNHACQPADVRGFIGISEGELPDTEVDLPSAYMDVAGALGVETLAQALAGDAAPEQTANRAIVAQAVINLLPSLPARISKAESDGTSKVERFQIDLGELERRANDLLEKSLRALSSDGSSITPTLVAVSSRTDPLTGA